MKNTFFDWKTFSEEYGNPPFPKQLMEEIFLIDLNKEKVWLSRKVAEVIYGGAADNLDKTSAWITEEEFEGALSENSRNGFRQQKNRLIEKKVSRVSCHTAIQSGERNLSSVIYMCPLEIPGMLLGFFSVDDEPVREYEKYMEQMIQKLQRAQDVNQLILEGASDYIYQLDVVNNICTFSPKAMDVLPLETPTFSDAMNRILSFIVPEDRQVFLNSFIPFLTGESDRHVAEYRVLTKQGEIMWISCQGKGKHDEQGRPLMIAGSLLDITEKKKHDEELQKMLYEDSLTGLKTRNCFERDMKERLKDENASGSLLYMDIRKFKLFNEMYGHEFGNLVLKEFAYMLNLFFSDALGIYRFSGDEFLVHLKETDHKRILARMAPFQGNLLQPREIAAHTVYLSTYVAVVLYPEHGISMEQLMNNANQCLYRISREDKKEVCFYTKEHSDGIALQFLLENEMRKDIEYQYRNFRVVYQPIVRVRDGEACWIGAEALLRYTNPEIPEADQMTVIHTLEFSGLIIPIGRWVIAQAAKECGRWKKNGCENAIVHINIAAQQVADTGLVEFIQNECRENEINPSQLVVELTETSLLSNFEAASRFCERLKTLGVGVALDDFGTGYSGFNYLRNLPLTQIKIDRAYTTEIQNNHYNQIIVSFMKNLTENLNLQLCVEGVETMEELNVIREKGIELIQGFYFERPMEAEMFRKEFPDRAKYRKIFPDETE